MEVERMSTPDAGEILKTAGAYAGATITVLTLAKVLHGPFKAMRQRRREKREKMDKFMAEVSGKLDTIDQRITGICKNDAELHARLEVKIDALTRDMRLSVSATGAALDGLMQHDSCINGPVKRWKERLEDRIQEGIGEPKA
jgi:hypothetical protein